MTAYNQSITVFQIDFWSGNDFSLNLNNGTIPTDWTKSSLLLSALPHSSS
jgi:hypothetical protein